MKRKLNLMSTVPFILAICFDVAQRYSTAQENHVLGRFKP